MPDSIESKLDQLLSKDLSQLTGSQILQIVAGDQDLSIPYDDLQSEEGFNKELEKVQGEVDGILAGLINENPPIPISKIEDLSCKYEGDELYANILLEALKNEDKNLYNEIINSDDVKSDEINTKDIGIKTEVKSLNPIKGKISSNKIVKSLSIKSPDFLRKTNESLFDHIDPLLLGKPSNAGCKKERELNILGFKLPLEFIMSGSKVVYVKISGKKLSIDEALKSINNITKKQNISGKPCDDKNVNQIEKDSDKESKKLNGNSLGSGNEENSNGTEANAYGTGTYDSKFITGVEDPITSQDCLPLLPEDSLTGDVIPTTENIKDILDEFCDPPVANNQAAAAAEGGVVEEEEAIIDPKGPEVDIKAIQACLDSAMDKAKGIEDSTKLIGRWQNIERSLEEIFYHYDIIHEYQKSLADTWRSRKDEPKKGTTNNLDLALKILTYKDTERELGRQIVFAIEDYNNTKKIFLQNNPIFTDNLFLFTVPETEFDDPTLIDFINSQIDAGISPIAFNEDSKSWPIIDAVDEFKNNIEGIRYVLLKSVFIEELKVEQQDTINLRDAAATTLSERTNNPVDINNLEKSFNITTYSGDFFNQGYVASTNGNGNVNQIDINKRIFQQSPNNNETWPYDSVGYNFLKEIQEFSVRFKNVKFNSSISELQFDLSFVNDFGNPLPYKETKKPGKISLDGSPVPAFITITEPDTDKIRIGNEYAGNGGLLTEYPKDFFNSSKASFFSVTNSNNYSGGSFQDPGKFLTIKNIKSGLPDVAPFYDFTTRVSSTGESKQSIIQRIVTERGILYGELIEKSASTWLFFNAAERGDNDARDLSKLRPASFNAEGEPIPAFSDFWGDFKNKWTQKYLDTKNAYINPKLESIKKEAVRAGYGLGQTLPVADIIGVRIFENYFDVKKKYEQIQEALLVTAQNIKEQEDNLLPEKIQKSFADLKCGNNNNNGQNQNDSVDCPPKCCGGPGVDFKNGGNFLMSSPPSSDCPTIFQRCWWKQFCKDVTKVGLLPYPNGLPPIEDPAFFLAQGPSVRLGLKYWPVGYLPPAFIPIPVPNPIDGQYFIRIPLPMIWTIIPPIVIALPLNLGVLVIFIPMIGGFMPTPLVYMKEFVTGSSLFLMGLRGPRFIPRKADPHTKDPLEKFKQVLSFGIPDKLIPLKGFGLDNIDSVERILTDIQRNFTKILDGIEPPKDIAALRDLQQKELDLKNKILDVTREYKKKAALLDDPAPNFDSDNLALNAIVNERKNVVKDVIKTYIDKSVPKPKSIVYPKDKDKLKIDIPGIVKSAQSLAELKSSLVPSIPVPTVNIKDNMKDVLKSMKIETPPKYDEENKGTSNDNQIFLRINKDPRSMVEDEFKELVGEIQNGISKIVDVILNGNGVSVDKKIRSGVFGLLNLGQYQGSIAFPPSEITESAPKTLDLTKVPNPLITTISNKIGQEVGKIGFKIDDFTDFIRTNNDGNAETVIRVKDLKKIAAKKIGLSKKKANEEERPLDKLEPIISNFPNPSGDLISEEKLSTAFGTAISAFELPTAFPPKQDQISQSPLAGGLIQITIPGDVIKKFVSEAVGKILDEGGLELIFPEIGIVDSPKFINLQPADIQKMVIEMIQKTVDPTGKVPPFLNLAKIPVLPPSRPTDIIEQIIIGFGAPPPARIVYSLFWKYFKGVPKTPLIDKIMPITELSSAILTKIPWPIAALLGRDVVNIMNPMVTSDDHPAWRRMSLKNVYYVVYIDEFIRSAADVSGLFKFFLGTDLIYPIPDLMTELNKKFNLKKY
jgi:hypothetical protein